MNIQSDAAREAFAEARGFSATALSVLQPFYWSVRREIWENHSIYVAPIAAAVISLFGFAISAIRVRIHGEAFLTTRHGELAPALIMGAAVIVSIFYCLEALYSERRDRSILFWKSLPVSDVIAVLAKLTIPILILPIVSFLVTVAAQICSLVLSTVIFAGSDVSIAMLWSDTSFFRVPAIWLYHLVTVHGLWYAPLYCWLLMVSAWAPRAPFLWAALPPFAIYGVERIAFNTSYFLDMLKYRLMGSGAGMTEHQQDFTSTLIPHHFLSTPGLWTGLAVAAVFLYGTVQLRRSRGPI